MSTLVHVLPSILLLLATAPPDSPAARAEATVTETPGRMILENDTVKVVFDAKTNCVPCELIYKKGSGQNLIVDNFCLYYQYIEGGAIRSVNEGYPGGRIANGQYKVEKKDGAATVEFRGDTPHFHLTRRVTVPAAGPAVKFVYELEATKADSFSFSLPYAPLWPKLNKLATYAELIGATGEKAGRVIVEDAKSPTLHVGSPYTQTECYFSDQTGEGLVFAHVPGECAAGISRCDTPKFAVGARERCAFVVVPFRGNYEATLTSYVRPKKSAVPDLSNASSAVVLKRTPEWVLWADHATRKVFPHEVLPATAPQGNEVTIEAAKGEYEPFQIVLTPQKDLADVKLVLAPLTNEKGDRLAAENLRYNSIGSLRSSYHEEIPDLLLQNESFECKKGRNAVFWVTVKVPLATAAGTYRGTLGLTSKGEKLAEVGLRLKVWDFALAPTPHIGAFATDYVYYYDNEVDLNNEAEVRAKVQKTTGADDEIAAYSTRMRFFADHRLYETHFGPRPNYAGAMRVHWEKKADDRYDFTAIDFRGFDKARQFCYDELHWPRFAYDPELVPYLGFINQYTFGGKNEEEYWYMRYWDPVLPKKDPKKYLPSIYDLHDDFTLEFKDKFLRYIHTIAEHCRAKGISIDENGDGPVLFLADEIPDYSSGHAVVKKTLELARMIKQAEPRVVLVVNGRDVPDDPEVLNLFDLWTARCPPDMLAKLRSMGKRYGDYYMHGYFNLRNSAIEPRVQFWSYWKYDFFWIGSWAMTMTPDQRWYGSKRNYANSWWFPSMKARYGEPMSTVRFELMREGLEDHEYLWMLRDRVAKLKTAAKGAASPDLLARAESLLRRAESAAGNYTSAGGEYYFDGYLQEPVKLLALRHDVAETLELLFAAGADAAGGGPWRAAEQPELKQALEQAPVLQTESLGEPARGVNVWERWMVPNPDGKTWDVLQVYFKEYYGPTWLFAIDLGTGQVKKQRLADHHQFYLSGRALGFDGKYYIATPSRKTWNMHMFVYDPATNTLEERGEIVPGLGGEVRPLAVGPDGRIYGTGTRGNRVGLYIYDPKLGKVVKDFGPVGPSHPNGAWSRYVMGVDDTHAYIASGMIPAWYLVAVNLQTGEEKMLLESPTQRVMDIIESFPGAWAIVPQGGGAPNKEYWLYHGEAIPRVNDTPPWPKRASPWEKGSTTRPQVYFDQIDPDANGHATLWYRSREDARAEEKAPRDAAARKKPEERGWKSIRLEGAETYPHRINPLSLLPDGRLYGTGDDYVGSFIFDPATDKTTYLGPRTGLAPYTTIVCGGKLYFSGYAGGPLVVYDPKQPWTLGKGGPPGQPAPGPDEPASNPRRIGEFSVTRVAIMHSSALGADGKIYFGGFGERGYTGGGLGWYDPKTEKLDGFWRPLSGYTVHWITPALGGRLIAISTSRAADELNDNQPPEEAKLFLYDVLQGKIVREIVPIAKGRTTGLIAEAAPGRLLGLTTDRERPDRSVLYGVDVATGDVLFRKALPSPVSTDAYWPHWVDPSYEYENLTRGPDGFVWTYLKDVLVRIDPKDASVHVVGKIAPVGHPTFVGKDVYLSGPEQLRRIRNVVPGR